MPHRKPLDSKGKKPGKEVERLLPVCLFPSVTQEKKPSQKLFGSLSLTFPGLELGHMAIPSYMGAAFPASLVVGEEKSEGTDG